MSKFSIAKMDDEGLDYSMLDPKVSYHIRKLGVNYEREVDISRLSLSSVYNTYEEKHDGFFVVRYLCNFQFRDNRYATVVIDKNCKKDNEHLAYETDFEKYNVFVGVDKNNVARIYFKDGTVVKVTNTEDRKIILEISKDGWDLMLSKVLRLNRVMDLETLKDYLAKKGKVEVHDKR